MPPAARARARADRRARRAARALPPRRRPRPRAPPPRPPRRIERQPAPLLNRRDLAPRVLEPRHRGLVIGDRDPALLVELGPPPRVIGERALVPRQLARERGMRHQLAVELAPGRDLGCE